MEDVANAMRTVFNGLTVHEQAFAALPTQVKQAVTDNITQIINSETVNSSSSGVSSFNSQTGAIVYFPGLGTVNDQLGQAAYTTQLSDNGAKIIVGDSTAVAVTMNSAKQAPYFTIIDNDSSSIANLTPSTGSLYGAQSIPSGGFGIVYFDGTNWWADAASAGGTLGVMGPPGMDGQDGEDSMIPGPPGPPGAQGAVGPPVYLEAPEADEPMQIPGPQNQPVTAHAIVISDMSNTVYANSQVVGIFYAPVAGVIPAGGTGIYNNAVATSYAYLQTAATASTVFTIKDGVTSVGTITFGVGGTTGTFSGFSAYTVASGDKITIVGPASHDTTAAGLNVSLVFAF
jgi:hypothetical protein